MVLRRLAHPKWLIVVCGFLLCVTTLCAQTQKAPFTVSIVPTASSAGGATISMAHDSPWLFYVVLTNISNEPQTVWEDGNSWGDQVVSFRVIAGDRTKAVISKRAGFFGKNTPRAFVVRPGEHKVYEVQIGRASCRKEC